MIKRLLVFNLVLATAVLLTAFRAGSGGNGKTGKLAAIKTVVIDAGHGGLFPGTRGLISKEKEVTLEIALKLGEAIKSSFPDVKVIYTRTTDACAGGATNLKDDLATRARIANEAKGDLFISIHCNATVQPAGGWYAKRVIGQRKKTIMVGRGRRKKKKIVTEPIYESYWVKNTRVGTETYVWKAGKQGDKINAIGHNEETYGEVAEDSTAEASAFNTDSPEWVIRTQLYEKRFLNNSILLSSLVEESFKNRGRISYGVKQRDVGIQVLQATGMPSILIETGFLSNKEEEEYLNSNKGQEEVVSDIVEGFRKYKQAMENKGGSRPAATGKK
jgi:N-acetylmuramoyl-L-alanine amidase